MTEFESSETKVGEDMTLTESLRQLRSLLADPHAGWTRAATDGSTPGLSFWQVVAGLEDARESSSQASDVNASARPLSSLLDQLGLLAEAPACPILAVAGFLNAGKTSLIAGFLSPQGRRRLLIGSSNQAGTHRFVLWLPEAWRRQDQLWAFALQHLTTVFGAPPEELSEDPEVAFQQYRGESLQAQLPPHITSPLEVPLIASDPGLDRAGLGLMDCPDIQTGELPGALGDRDAALAHGGAFPGDGPGTSEVRRQSAMVEARRQALARGLKLASAMVVVSSANSIQDENLQLILREASEARPGLKMVLAINRVPRRYTTGEIADEIAQGYRALAPWRVYLAYHFDGPLHPDRRVAIDDGPRSLPYFFRIDRRPSPQPPDLVAADDRLLELAGQLDGDELRRETLAAAARVLAHTCRATAQACHARGQAAQARLARVHQSVAEACLSFSRRSDAGVESEEIRLQVSREIVAQLAESLERTAPWWAWPGRRMLRWSEQLRHTAAHATRWISVPTWLSQRAASVSQWIREGWQRGEGGRVVSTAGFAQAVQEHDARGDLHEMAQQPTAWRQRLQAAIDRFQEESRTRLPDALIDQVTTDVWHRMPWRQRLVTGLVPAGIIFAPLVAVVMVPMDFGGTSVLVFASFKELLWAGVASLGVAMLHQDTMPSVAEAEAAWQQVSDLYAITCDALGLPRPAAEAMPRLRLGRSHKPLLPSLLPVQPTSPSAIALPVQASPSFNASLESILNQLEQSLA